MLDWEENCSSFDSETGWGFTVSCLLLVFRFRIEDKDMFVFVWGEPARVNPRRGKRRKNRGGGFLEIKFFTSEKVDCRVGEDSQRELLSILNTGTRVVPVDLCKVF